MGFLGQYCKITAIIRILSNGEITTKRNNAKNVGTV